MIKSFRHKGLEQLYTRNETKLINRAHEARIRSILNIVDGAEQVNDINLPGLRLHKLKGAKQDAWSVKVSGNWRITFRYENGDVYEVNLEDYH